MNVDIAEQWIAALESGKFRQGVSTLEGVNGNFCCLGVLCAIAPEDMAMRNTDEDGNVDYDGNFSFIPESVQHWAGMESRNGQLNNVLTHDGYGQVTSLIYFNDVKRYTFTQIAQLIRENMDSL